MQTFHLYTISHTHEFFNATYMVTSSELGRVCTHSDCQYGIIRLVKEITNMGKVSLE